MVNSNLFSEMIFITLKKTFKCLQSRKYVSFLSVANNLQRRQQSIILREEQRAYNIKKFILKQANCLWNQSIIIVYLVSSWRLEEKEQDYDRSNAQRDNRLVILFNIKPSLHHGTLGKNTTLFTPKNHAL
jgi:hypothetical protein